VKVLAEIPPPAAPAARAGTLRRCDLEAFERLLGELRGSRTVVAIGEPDRRRSVALGLATAAAAAGTRTALIECDLSCPTLAEALGVAVAPGLHEYLRGEAEAGSILEAFVLAGPGAQQAREPLVCVVAGRLAPDGRPLLASERFRQATARLRDAYELVVLEAPSPASWDGALPALAVEADATLACIGRGDPPPDTPFPIAGIVVQG
jgi:Mrp family chromosome partitioning ATPase